MKNYRIFIISLLLLIFMIGAVSATEENSTDNLEISGDISISEETLPSVDNMGEDQSSSSDDVLGVSTEDSTSDDIIADGGESSPYKAVANVTSYNVVVDDGSSVNLQFLYKEDDSPAAGKNFTVCLVGHDAEDNVIINNYNFISDSNGVGSFLIDVPEGYYEIQSIYDINNCIVRLPDGVYISVTVTSTILKNTIVADNATFTAIITYDLSILGAGVYNVTVVNPVTGERRDYAITVTVAETISASDVTVTYGVSSKFTANFTDQYGVALANTNVTFKVGENTINATTDVNGIAVFSIVFDAGNYNVTITNPVTCQVVTKSIAVKPLATKLSASKLTMVYNTGKYLKATLKDANGKALAKQKVYIKINGKTFERTTNTNGQVSLKITLPVKTYTATITYKGTTNYVKSSASVKVVVKKASPKMTAKAKTLKTKTKKYTIVLKDNKGKAMKKVKVTLTTKVNGKKVKLTVKTKNNGKATFNLKKLVKGKYTAAVKFAGNKNFKAVTKKVKITVKK